VTPVFDVVTFQFSSLPTRELLDVLAVIALSVGQSKRAFFKDGIVAIPQGDGEAKALFHNSW
jgi:hypothetical protein